MTNANINEQKTELQSSILALEQAKEEAEGDLQELQRQHQGLLERKKVATQTKTKGPKAASLNRLSTRISAVERKLSAHDAELNAKKAQLQLVLLIESSNVNMGLGSVNQPLTPVVLESPVVTPQEEMEKTPPILINDVNEGMQGNIDTTGNAHEGVTKEESTPKMTALGLAPNAKASGHSLETRTSDVQTSGRANQNAQNPEMMLSGPPLDDAALQTSEQRGLRVEGDNNSLVTKTPLTNPSSQYTDAHLLYGLGLPSYATGFPGIPSPSIANSFDAAKGRHSVLQFHPSSTNGTWLPQDLQAAKYNFDGSDLNMNPTLAFTSGYEKALRSVQTPVPMEVMPSPVPMPTPPTAFPQDSNLNAQYSTVVHNDGSKKLGVATNPVSKSHGMQGNQDSLYAGGSSQVAGDGLQLLVEAVLEGKDIDTGKEGSNIEHSSNGKRPMIEETARGHKKVKTGMEMEFVDDDGSDDEETKGRKKTWGSSWRKVSNDRREVQRVCASAVRRWCRTREPKSIPEKLRKVIRENDWVVPWVARVCPELIFLILTSGRGMSNTQCLIHWRLGATYTPKGDADGEENPRLTGMVSIRLMSSKTDPNPTLRPGCMNCGCEIIVGIIHFMMQKTWTATATMENPKNRAEDIIVTEGMLNERWSARLRYFIIEAWKKHTDLSYEESCIGPETLVKGWDAGKSTDTIFQEFDRVCEKKRVLNGIRRYIRAQNGQEIGMDVVAEMLEIIAGKERASDMLAGYTAYKEQNAYLNWFGLYGNCDRSPGPPPGEDWITQGPA